MHEDKSCWVVQSFRELSLNWAGWGEGGRSSADAGEGDGIGEGVQVRTGPWELMAEESVTMCYECRAGMAWL